jgi:hypothetical protein
VISTELRLALTPGRTYRQLVDAERTGARGLLASLAFSAVTAGVTVALVATQRATPGLVATTTASWSFVLLIQAVAAAVIILFARRRHVSLPRAFALLFLGHAPWSVWLLALGGMALLLEGEVDLDYILVGAFVPVAWTLVIVAAFCRTVLAQSGAMAWTLAGLHQAIVWALGLSYIAWAAGGWMRIVQTVMP